MEIELKLNEDERNILILSIEENIKILQKELAKVEEGLKKEEDAILRDLEKSIHETLKNLFNIYYRIY